MRRLCYMQFLFLFFYLFLEFLRILLVVVCLSCFVGCFYSFYHSFFIDVRVKEIHHFYTTFFLTAVYCFWVFKDKVQTVEFNSCIIKNPAYIKDNFCRTFIRHSFIIKIDGERSGFAKWISSEKTNFKPALFKDEHYEQEIVFSYGIKLTEQQLEKLLPLCNALDFEPFRNREMVMGEDGYCGYRDEVRVQFRGITNSHIPLLELPMYYYYDSEHIWPSEKLYHHIIKNIFDKQKKMKGWYTAWR